MNNSNVTDIFTYEQAVFSKLQDYNQAYTTYNLCNSTDTTIKANALSKNLCGVNGTNTISTPNATSLNNSITDLSNAIATYKNINTSKTNTQYDASMVDLTTRYQKVLELRADIDTKLQSFL